MRTTHDGRRESAFTVAELLVCLTSTCLLMGVLWAGAGDERMAVRSLKCLNNLQQLGAGWLMYADDHQGRLAPNRASFSPSIASWVGGWLDYTSSPQNTNISLLVGPTSTSGLLGPYVRSAAYFRCPSDPSTVVIAGERYPRIRSYSMNNFVGEGAGALGGGTTAYQLYSKLQSILRPSPDQLWVITEEHPDSINDGTFFTTPDNATPTFIDLPATYHPHGCNFVFADGHSASRRWLDNRTTFPIGMFSISPTVSINNGDLLWLMSHATAPVSP